MSRSQLLTISISIASLTGCATPRMAVPQSLGAASDEIVVTDRSSMSGSLANESFKMGPYQVVDVDRKWTSTSGTSLGAAYSSAKSKDGYTFALKAPEGAYRGECASMTDDAAASVVGVAVGHHKTEVLCQCSGPAKVALTMRAHDNERFQGTVSARNASFAVDGVYTDEKGASVGKAIGYVVHGPSDTVGAVEVAGKGRVWLNKGADPAIRADVACLFAGLLLHKPPQGSAVP